MSNFKVGDTYFDSKVKEGTKIKFLSEKQKYTVISSNHFISICTKPFNPEHTVLYCVIDWHRQMRSTEDLVFGMGAETKKECDEMLERITQGESDLSERHEKELDIESFEEPKNNSTPR